MAKPRFSIQVDPSLAESSSSAKFIIEPLPQGFGHTLGNSLRRVLYTSIPGAALTSVTVSSAPHQFSSLEGVQEDVIQLVLALKQVRFSYSSSEPAHLRLSAKGPGAVTASQFELPTGVTIANGDLVIAHLADKNAKLDLEATVESGFGYSPAEDRKSTAIGVIPTDAVFTPISRVNYTVEATRVGRLTNYDKLLLEITTDGTIAPKDALTTAAQVLVDYFSVVVNPEADAREDGTSAASSPTLQNQPGSVVSIEELDLPTRISNALQKAGFETVADLLAVPRGELAKIKNLGIKSVKIVELALSQRGFQLAA